MSCLLLQHNDVILFVQSPPAEFPSTDFMSVILIKPHLVFHQTERINQDRGRDEIQETETPTQEKGRGNFEMTVMRILSCSLGLTCHQIKEKENGGSKGVCLQEQK